MSAKTVTAILALKRDGGELDEASIKSFVRGASGDSEWADYQLSAMLMAIFIRGMTLAETVALTCAVVASGVRVDWAQARAAGWTHVIDKHSTGGVGDKVSLPLAAMVAACGVAVPMLSGRGLGHTGGTLDKLEAIPGMRVHATPAEFVSIVTSVGTAIVGAGADLAPADARLYALRDVTATVESMPLIAASIIGKKVAGGADGLVLDVKYGAGAFMTDRSRALALANELVALGKALGLPVCAVLTSVHEPLGRTVGNALEVAEALACLRGTGPPDVMAVTLALGEQMLMLAGAAPSAPAARAALLAAVKSGAALAKFRDLVVAQGGDARAVDDPAAHLPRATLQLPVCAPTEGAGAGGYVVSVNAMAVALAALRLGAGRAHTSDGVDHAVGVAELVKTGERVAPGGVLCIVHANDAVAAAAARDMLAAAICLAPEPVSQAVLVDEIIC